MQGMIFAAGIGSRLKPFTDHHPKALVKVGSRPMLGHVIERMRDAGINHIVVNVHHFSEQIRDYLAANDFGVSISISDESACLLDTGGGILAARHLLKPDEPILVHNADIYTDLQLSRMAEQWHNRQDTMAMLLADQRNTTRYLLFSDTGRMRGWVNTKSGELRPGNLKPELAKQLKRLAFGGIHILSPEIFGPLTEYGASNGKVFSIMNFYIHYCTEKNIMAYTPDSPYEWYDVGKPETLEAARSSIVMTNGKD